MEVVQCRSTPLPPELIGPLDARRRLLASQQEVPVMFPVDAYAIVFLMQPDPVIQRALQTMIKDERRRIARSKQMGTPIDAPGVIYAFWVTGQPTNQIKIGRSTQESRQRVAEWNRMLATQGEVVNLLFTHTTRYNILAEKIIHTTLSCERLPHLKHSQTGRDLTEFFRIDNVLALSLFVALAVRYADSIGDELNLYL